MTNKKRYVTRNESFLIYELLKKHGIRKSNNIYEYNDGWDDSTIAEAAGNGISRWSVKTIRTQSFGILKQIGSSQSSELERRVEDLERLVSVMSRALVKIDPQAFSGSTGNKLFTDRPPLQASEF